MATVLLVDDDIDYLEAETEALRELGGFDVSPVSDLAEAIRAARSGTFGILVTDKNIGGHRGLVPLLDFMQQERPETPVLINSAEPDEGVRQHLYCHDFHNKGAEPPDALIEKINRLLGNRVASRPMWDRPRLQYPRDGD